MRILIQLVAFLVLISITGSADAENSNGDPKALAVLIISDPWASVIGSDSPTFALYEDGTVIYLQEDGAGVQCLSTKLTMVELEQLLDQISPQQLESLDRYYEISRATDQPTSLVTIRMPGGVYKRIWVYGFPDSPLADTSQLPNGLSRLLHVMKNYNHPRATPWLPDFLEVMVWPWDHTKGRGLAWPEAWPGLQDPRTIKRRQVHSIYIEKSRASEVFNFLAQRKAEQPLIIDKKRWTVSIRFPFPQEALWMPRAKETHEPARK